jgi:hypothetical protein
MEDRSASRPTPKLSRHRFDVDEDFRLLELVHQYGVYHWELVAASMPARTARQCRDRYNNYLSAQIARTPWEPWEDALIARRHGELGPQWSLIAHALNAGRTPTQVKNRWASYHRLPAEPVTMDSRELIERVFGPLEEEMEALEFRYGDDDSSEKGYFF